MVTHGSRLVFIVTGRFYSYEDSKVENDEKCHPSHFFCSLW